MRDSEDTFLDRLKRSKIGRLIQDALTPDEANPRKQAAKSVQEDFEPIESLSGEDKEKMLGLESFVSKGRTGREVISEIEEDFPSRHKGFKITSGERSPEEQDRLYAQHQSDLKEAFDALFEFDEDDPIHQYGPDEQGDWNADYSQFMQDEMDYEDKVAVRDWLKQRGRPPQVALPGESKHETGEAIDVNISYFTDKETGQLNADGVQLVEALASVGFVRPEGTIRHEPWHFEYIGEGKPDSKKIENAIADATQDRTGSTFTQRVALSADEALEKAMQTIRGEGPPNQGIADLEQYSADIQGKIEGLSTSMEENNQLRLEAEQRVVENTYDMAKLQEEQKIAMAQEEQGRLDALHARDNELAVKSAETLAQMDAEIADLYDQIDNPETAFGFFDRDGQFSWSKATSTVAAAVGFTLNAFLAVGSRGDIPMVAWRMITDTIDNEVRAQKESLVGKFSVMAERYSMLGRIRGVIGDEIASTIAYRNNRFKAMDEHLDVMKALSARDPDKQSAIEAVQQRFKQELQAGQLALEERLKDVNLKVMSQKVQEQVQEDNREAAAVRNVLDAGLKAHGVGKPKSREQKRVQEAALLKQDIITMYNMWEEQQGYGAELTRYLVDKFGSLSAVPSAYRDTDSFKNARILKDKIEAKATAILKFVRQETGNLAVSENQSAEMMLAFNDSYEAGRAKLLNLIGIMMIAEASNQFTNDEYGRILAEGFENIPKDWTNIRSIDAQTRVWRGHLDSLNLQTPKDIEADFSGRNKSRWSENSLYDEMKKAAGGNVEEIDD